MRNEGPTFPNQDNSTITGTAYAQPGLASIPEASILYRHTSVLVSVSISANSIDTLVHTSYYFRPPLLPLLPRLFSSFLTSYDDGFRRGFISSCSFYCPSPTIEMVECIKHWKKSGILNQIVI